MPGTAAPSRRAISSVCASAIVLLRVPIRNRVVTGRAPLSPCILQDPDAVDEGGAVGLGRQIIDADFRRKAWIGASDLQRAAALGPQLADGCGETGKRMQLLTHLVGRERDEVDLDIRRRQTRTGLE